MERDMNLYTYKLNRDNGTADISYDGEHILSVMLGIYPTFVFHDAAHNAIVQHVAQ